MNIWIIKHVYTNIYTILNIYSIYYHLANILRIKVPFLPRIHCNLDNNDLHLSKNWVPMVLDTIQTNILQVTNLQPEPSLRLQSHAEFRSIPVFHTLDKLLFEGIYQSSWVLGHREAASSHFPQMGCSYEVLLGLVCDLDLHLLLPYLIWDM